MVNKDKGILEYAICWTILRPIVGRLDKGLCFWINLGGICFKLCIRSKRNLINP